MRKSDLEQMLAEANGSKNFYLNHYNAMTDIFVNLKTVYPELFNESNRGMLIDSWYMGFGMPRSFYQDFKAYELQLVADAIRKLNKETSEDAAVEAALRSLKLND